MSKTYSEKKACDVLLTYGWNRLTYNILRNLTQNGLRVVVGDESKYNISSISKHSYDSFQYPSPFVDHESFINALLEAIVKYRPKVLIPCHEETFVIAKYIDRFPKDIVIPITDYKTLMSAHDKISANKIAISLGIPTPKIYDISNFEEIEKNKDTFTYPLVVKLANSNAAKGVFYAHNYDELKEIYKSNSIDGNNIFIQEYASGNGYGASFLYNKGDMVTGFVHKRLIEKTHTGGVSTKRISVKNKSLFDSGKKILDHLKWHGPAMVEFKYDEEREKFWFIEINARYWGSLSLPIAAGLEIPYWHYLNAMDEIIKPAEYRENVVSLWILGNFITIVERILCRKLTFKELGSLLNFKADNYDDLYFDDLRAFSGEIIYYFSKFLKTKSVNPKIDGMGNF